MATAKAAKSISSSDLAKFTKAAVKSAAQGVPGRFVGTGPTMGFIARAELGAKADIELATAITTGLVANAKAAGFSGLKVKPLVVKRSGGITMGFILSELNIPIR